MKRRLWRPTSTGCSCAGDPACSASPLRDRVPPEGRHGKAGTGGWGWVGRGVLAFALCLVLGPSGIGAEPERVSLESSNPKLQRAFEWAVAKALSYVQTGKTGPVDGHERDRQGRGSVNYIPSYWAGYTWRTAFYSRDFCHQADGAHLLGLEKENLSMLQAFARSATPARKGYPLWALNFDGSSFRLDHESDDLFVREVPAVFELVEQCHRQYLWTGNPVYLDDPDLRRYCQQAVTGFITSHDRRRPNGVAEGDGSGDIFRGTATYNEIHSPLIEAGDGIACEYQAFLAQARLLAARGDPNEARIFEEKAGQLRSYFNREWGRKPGADLWVRGYDVQGNVLTDFGRENSWFLPMKFITDPSPRTDAYLEFIARSVASPEGRPPNLEAITYLPGTFFPYHLAEEGWKWMEYIIDQPGREYPEVSFTLVGHTVVGLLGFEPDAPEHRFQSLAHLPRAIGRVTVRNLPLGGHRLDLGHEGAGKSTATHRQGDGPIRWEAGFVGTHPTLRVDGRAGPATHRAVHGVPASFVTVTLAAGQSATVETPP